MLPEAVINDQYLMPLLHALVDGLTAEPRVAANVCWVGSTVLINYPELSISFFRHSQVLPRLLMMLRRFLMMQANQTLIVSPNISNRLCKSFWKLPTDLMATSITYVQPLMRP
jgi:hypothetical protein